MGLAMKLVMESTAWVDCLHDISRSFLICQVASPRAAYCSPSKRYGRHVIWSFSREFRRIVRSSLSTRANTFDQVAWEALSQLGEDVLELPILYVARNAVDPQYQRHFAVEQSHEISCQQATSFHMSYPARLSMSPSHREILTVYRRNEVQENSLIEGGRVPSQLGFMQLGESMWQCPKPLVFMLRMFLEAQSPML